MLNSHEFLITCHSFQALSIIENETDNIYIDVSQPCRAISVGVAQTNKRTFQLAEAYT